MAGKITEYANSRTTFVDGDLFDVSAFLNPGYESQKTTWLDFKNNLNTAGYLKSGDNVSELVNDAGYLTSVPSGKVGIANTSGVYTFYSTLQAAITAASAGQTVELFSDITETTDITVTLKDGVKINGNGHTYTLDFASATHAITANTANGNYYLHNINIKRVNSTSGSGFIVSDTGISVYGKNTYVEADGTAGAVNVASSTTYIENFTGRNTGAGEGIRAGTTTTKIYNCIGYAVSDIGIGDIFGYGIIVNCIAETDSGFSAIYGREVFNSYGKGNTGRGVSCEGDIDSCVGYSSTQDGIYGGQNSNIYNSKGESNTGVGIRCSRDVYNCTAISNTNYGMTVAIQTGKISNTTIISTANYGLHMNSNATWTGGAYITNCHIESKLDSTSGHAIYFTASNTATTVEPEVTNNHLKVKNAGAYGMIYIPGTVTTRNIKYTNNSFSGMTTAVEAAITQGTSNTEDSQGNIIT